MSHKRGRDKRANDKRTLIELNRAAYCNLVEVAFDAMYNVSLFAERHKLNRFADTLPVFWPKKLCNDFVGVIFEVKP